MTCSGGCKETCNTTCTGDCKNNCGTTCNKNCNLTCSTGCTSSCTGTCSNTCTGSCSGDCDNACTAVATLDNINAMGNNIAVNKIINASDIQNIKNNLRKEMARRNVTIDTIQVDKNDVIKVNTLKDLNDIIKLNAVDNGNITASKIQSSIELLRIMMLKNIKR